jgi:hypothetical protein
MSKIFRHCKTGRLYELLGTARCSDDPTLKRVVYTQLIDSAAQEGSTTTQTHAPAATLWMCCPHAFDIEFRRQFEKRPEKRSNGGKIVGKQQNDAKRRK